MQKIKYKILLLMGFITILVNAQENQPFPKVEEMHNRKWEFLVEKAHLSPQDADAVKPVFLDYEKALWSFHAKNGEFFKSLKNRKNDLSINYSEINDRYADIEITQAQMFKSYHLKLRKILAPETLFKYYKAEREFKRKLLQNLQDFPKNGKPFERQPNN
jgi:hypothetical protein